MLKQNLFDKPLCVLELRIVKLLNIDGTPINKKFN